MPTPTPDALLAAIVGSSDDAIVSKDLNGIVTSWNRAAERLFGYRADEMIGQPIAILAAPGRETEMPEILARIRRGERLEHFETQRRHKDGHPVDISLSVSPILDDAGRVIGASKIARDITEQKRLMERNAVLAHEVDHRAKNVMAAALAVVRLTYAADTEELRMKLEGRIGAMGAIQTLISRRAWDGATVRDILASVLCVTVPEHARVSVSGPRYFVCANAAQTLGKTFHELASNAERYGALSVPQGRVDVTLRTDVNGALVIDWKEHGGPRVVQPARLGFGGRMIGAFVPHEVQGEAALMWEPDGVRCRLVVPQEHLCSEMLAKHWIGVAA